MVFRNVLTIQFDLSETYDCRNIPFLLPPHELSGSKGFALSNKILPFFLVVLSIKLNNAAPSLHLHYRDFITTTGCSAPVLRIVTLILMGPPLGFLPYHRNDKFPRSTQEPDSRSRHLYAGRRPGSKQDSPGLIPEYHKPPVLTSSLSFRHLISGSLALASLNHT